MSDIGVNSGIGEQQWGRMNSDIEIHNELAKILLCYPTKNSLAIKFKFLIESDIEGNETGTERFYFDYVHKDGNEDWFVINNVCVPSKIADLCLEL